MRYYSPALGVFTSRDPFEGVVGRAMSYNGYTYAEGNPVNLVDPTGEFPFIIAVLLGAPIIAAVTGSAWNLFVEQGRGVNGGHQFDPFMCVDWNNVSSAGVATGLGVVAAAAGMVFGVPYTVGALLDAVNPSWGFTPTEFNRALLDFFGLGDEYDELLSNLYFQAGSAAGAFTSLVISYHMYSDLLLRLQQGNGVLQFATLTGE